MENVRDFFRLFHRRVLSPPLVGNVTDKKALIVGSKQTLSVEDVCPPEIVPPPLVGDVAAVY